MPESIRDRYGRWRLEELLLQHPGLRIVPSHDDRLLLAGTVQFCLQGPKHGPIEDAYAVTLSVPVNFPETLPTVREKGGRIPATFHKLDDGSLCVGAPTELRLHLTRSPTLLTFIDKFVVAYLFGHSYFERHGVMPFGELAHGSKGLWQHLAELFRAKASPEVTEFLLLASMKKRCANKHLCPCGSGRRLGRCHHRRVNQLRDRLGRQWFRSEYERVKDHLDCLDIHRGRSDTNRFRTLNPSHRRPLKRAR